MMVNNGDQFVKEWESSMKEAHDIARVNMEKMANYNKQHYDGKAKAVEIKVGDMVLVQNMREREGKAKMRSYWEENLFRVSKVSANVPVYTIVNIRKSKDIRVVHRNKLMRVNELPLNVFGEVTDNKQNQKAQKTPKKQVKQDNIPSVEEVLDSASSDDAVVVIEQNSVPPSVPVHQETIPDVVPEVDVPSVPVHQGRIFKMWFRKFLFHSRKN